jgi:integrase
LPIIPICAENPARTGFLEDAKYWELARKRNKVGLWLRALLTVAYSFAFRKGELLSLRVRQVDLASREIHLEAGRTKNGEARTAPMTDEVSTLLTACVIGKKPDDFVFTRRDGTPVQSLLKVWTSVCCAVGVGRLVCRSCYAEAKQKAKESREQIVIRPAVDAKGSVQRAERGGSEGSKGTSA